MKSIWRVLRTRCGNARLDFGQPFSLQVGHCYYCSRSFINSCLFRCSVSFLASMIKSSLSLYKVHFPPLSLYRLLEVLTSMCYFFLQLGELKLRVYNACK